MGFDYYLSESADIVGDVHKLSSYFDEKDDLIFPGAVFKHFALPWMVLIERVRLLKQGSG